MDGKIVNTLNVEELSVFLEQNGFSSTIINKLQDEEIDGECLLKLQESHLSSFQFKAGTRMKLLSFIDKMRELQSHSETLRLTESDSICGAVSTGMHSSDISIMSTVPNADSSRATTSNGDSEKVNYDVIGMLKSDAAGQSVLENYMAREVPMISNEERIIIVQVTVKCFTDQLKTLYPSSTEKHALAKAIVDTFPCLKCNVPDVSPHCSFYNSKTNSFIETRLKTIREPQKRKRTNESGEKSSASGKKLKSADLQESSFETEKGYVSWMKDRIVNTVNKATIAQYMETTFIFRRLQIDQKKFKTATDILEEYPRFVDFDNGSLVITEFYRLYKEASYFDDFIHQYQERIIFLAESEKMGVGKKNIHNCSDRCLSALLYCLKLQPSVMKLKVASSMADVVDQLIIFRKENWDIHEFSKNRTTYPKQPFILCLGTINSPSSFSVIIEDTFIPCGESIQQAFKVLYCSFYCFGLQYPKHMHTFYRFFDDMVFKVSTRKGKALATCLAFEARLKSVQLPMIEELDEVEQSSVIGL